MTGSAEHASRRVSMLRDHRYVLADGGEGARLASALRREPRLAAVSSPRHADVLIVVEPITRKFASAVAELYRALPRPRRAITIGHSTTRLVAGDIVQTAEVIPGVAPVPSSAALAEPVVGAAAARSASDGSTQNHWALDPVTIPLPPKHEREMATELVVLSLGPVQPFAAGPLRLLLISDGEQVVSATLEAGYARRGIEGAMRTSSWATGAQLAGGFDPLAPLSGRLVYVEAVERLMGYDAGQTTRAARHVALALERTEDTIWWLERFSTVLGHDSLSNAAYELALELALTTPRVWQEPIQAWLAPRGGIPGIEHAEHRRLTELATAMRNLVRRVERDAFSKSRLQGIGVLSAHRAREAGISGPVLQASVGGRGDAWTRVIARLRSAASDLDRAVSALPSLIPAHSERATFVVPAGEARATVSGPRGDVAVRLLSDGGENPVVVEWTGPSSAGLRVVPDLLADQRLADAEAIVASVDLAMAEADG